VLDVNVSTSHCVSILSQQIVWQPQNVVVDTVLILVMLLFL